MNTWRLSLVGCLLLMSILVSWAGFPSGTTFTLSTDQTNPTNFSIHVETTSHSVTWIASVSGSGTGSLDLVYDTNSNGSYSTVKDTISISAGSGQKQSSELGANIPNVIGTYYYKLRGTVNGSPQLSTNYVTVTVYNTTPTASGQSVSTNEDTAVTITLSGSDADTDDNDSLSYYKGTGPSHGTLSDINANHQVTYTPDANYNNTTPTRDSFTFRVRDDHVADSTYATVCILVNSVNDPPVAVADAYETDEDTPLSITAPGILGNDTDIENETLTAVQVSGPSHAATNGFTLNSNGSFSYTPAANWFGVDAFTYKANDDPADSNVVTVTITVNSVNDPPVIDQGTSVLVVMDEDGSPTAFSTPTLTATDIDDAAGALTWSKTTDPSHGTATVSGAGVSPTTLTYTPTANYFGTDSFTVQVIDDDNASDTIVVNVSINPVNDAPSFTPGGTVIVVNDNSARSIYWASGISAGPNETGQSVYFVVDDYSNHSLFSSGPSIDAAGELHFTPAAELHGVSDITVTLHDAADQTFGSPSLSSNPVTFRLVITLPENQSIDTDEDTAKNISLTDFEHVGSAVIYTSPAGSLNGLITGTGTDITYQPLPDFFGYDMLNFTITDTYGKSATGAIVILVRPINDAPIAKSGLIITDEDEPVVGEFDASDIDSPTMIYSIVDQGSLGTVTITNSISGYFSYVPASNVFGTDTFTYQVFDGALYSSVMTITVSIVPVNDPPMIEQGAEVSVSMDEDANPEPFEAPTITATDTENDPLTWSLGVEPAHGVASVGGTGSSPSITYIQDENYFGFDWFSAVVDDGNGGACEIFILITINPINDVPVIEQGDSVFVLMDEDGSPSAFDTPTIAATDADDDLLTWSLPTGCGPSHGTATVEGIGASPTIIYTPDDNYFGTDSFTVQVDDGVGGSATIVVDVSINPVNDAPEIDQYGSVLVVMDEDGSPTAFSAPTITATDIENDTLTWSLPTGGGASHGTATVSGTGVSPTITYVPADNYFGTDSFTVQVEDGNGGSATIVVDVSINPLNDAPEIDQDGSVLVVMDEDGSPTAFSAPTITATDIENDTLTWSLPTGGGASHGTATVNGTGSPSICYTPAPDYFGTDSFTVRVDDGHGSTDDIVVNVSINPVNDPPVSQNGSVATLVDTPVNGYVVANDVDTSVLVYSIDSNGIKGTAVITNANTGAYTYTPYSAQSGMDSFTFTAYDGYAYSNCATVTVTIDQ